MKKLIDLEEATFKALSIMAIEAGTNNKSCADGGFKDNLFTIGEVVSVGFYCLDDTCKTQCDHCKTASSDEI
jgi:hypothetical protein